MKTFIEFINEDGEGAPVSAAPTTVTAGIAKFDPKLFTDKKKTPMLKRKLPNA